MGAGRRHKSKPIVRERCGQVPVGQIGRPLRGRQQFLLINQEFAGQRLVAGFYPDLPVHIVLIESQMMTKHSPDPVQADIKGVGHVFHQEIVSVSADQIGQGDLELQPGNPKIRIPVGQEKGDDAVAATEIKDSVGRSRCRSKASRSP